jgi:uncharacterized protein YcfJ
MNGSKKIKTLLVGSVIALTATPAFAESVRATVQDHYKTVIEQEPYRVEVCRDVNVPVGNSGTNTEGAIIGGIIGGVVGNQFGSGSGKEAMTGIGALTGAIIGGQNNQPQGHRTERQCSVETRYQERQREVYSHSTITFRENSRNYTLKFEK